MSTTTNTQRINSMDALRALAMFLGVVLHAVMAYTMTPFENFYHDPHYSSGAYDVIFFVIHTFRMQLFYLIAGFFFRLLYFRIGEAAFIKHRTQRILIPFVVGLFLILPFTNLPLTAYTVTGGGQHLTGPDVSLILHNIMIWRGPVHLWFLYYLTLFYIIGIVLLRLKLPRLPAAIVPALLLVGSFVSLMLFDTYYIKYTPGLIPKPNYILYYGIFVYAGWVLHEHKEKYFPLLKRYGLAFTAIGMAAALLIYYNSTTADIFLKAGMTIATSSLVLGFLGVFIRWVNAESYTMRYLSDASYWVYLVHVGLVYTMQAWLGDTQLPGILKPVLCFIVPVAISLLTYQWFVRYTIIGFYLHGKREKSNNEEHKRVYKVSTSKS
ncbi:acyltransferase family protein [Chitinophaga sancti]|uniref:acyltransferase family protein n=1 Tax=Chitinophaga sancti TaxID=1004 RepID=UPI002A75F8EA|nr:acyltransferase family protein [Chitinophaga sancti]WPQ60959.1 acyltransferase family protein [Chitinophaga sancti]